MEWTFLLRGGTTAQWADKNPVLALREPGVEFTDDGEVKMKFGDDVTHWLDLPYLVGAVSATANAYMHDQGTPSDEWVVQHDLGYFPAGLQVFDSGGSEWEGEVEHVNVNRLIIRFNGVSFAGIARVS